MILPGLRGGGIGPPQRIVSCHGLAKHVESLLFLRGLQADGEQFRGVERLQQKAGSAVTHTVHRGLQRAVGGDHYDFNFAMSSFDFF